MKTHQVAAEEFEVDVAGGGPHCVDDLADEGWLRQLQADLASWQTSNFGATPVELLALGVCEEAGELAHAILKRKQRIRGMEDEAAYKAAVADAAGDICIYLMNLLTTERLSFEAVLRGTAKHVIARDWRANTKDGGQ